MIRKRRRGRARLALCALLIAALAGRAGADAPLLVTVGDVTRYTAAGDGCTACHPAIRQYLAYLSDVPPSCSDK